MDKIVSVIWDLEDEEEGNVAHIAQHGLTPDEVDEVLFEPWDEGVSSTGRACRYGETNGRYVKVVFEWVDDGVVYPVTAFETPYRGNR